MSPGDQPPVASPNGMGHNDVCGAHFEKVVWQRCIVCPLAPAGAPSTRPGCRKTSPFGVSGIPSVCRYSCQRAPCPKVLKAPTTLSTTPPCHALPSCVAPLCTKLQPNPIAIRSPGLRRFSNRHASLYPALLQDTLPTRHPGVAVCR